MPPSSIPTGARLGNLRSPPHARTLGVDRPEGRRSGSPTVEPVRVMPVGPVELVDAVGPNGGEEHCEPAGRPTGLYGA